MKKFPKSHELNGNFAIFLHEIRKDYDQAEDYYKRALNSEPDNAHFNGNYSSLLLGLGRKNDGVIFLEKAEKLTDKDKGLLLELAFYRLALFPETANKSREQIHQYLDEGITSPGWDFSNIIIQAKKEGCEYVDELKELAEKISKVE